MAPNYDVVLTLRLVAQKSQRLDLVLGCTRGRCIRWPNFARSRRLLATHLWAPALVTEKGYTYIEDLQAALPDCSLLRPPD